MDDVGLQLEVPDINKSYTASEAASPADLFRKFGNTGARGAGSSAAAMACFLRGFLANPADVASIIPSSRFLQRKLSSLPCIRRADTVVELGPGVGSTTRALLREMHAESRLLGIELVPEFVDYLRRNDDPRLQVVGGSAMELEYHLNKHLVPPPDVIVSGIPFSTMQPADAQALVENIHDALAPGGQFIAYQVRNHISRLASLHFGAPDTSLVLCNVPPLRIFCWTKE